jgi:prevent-host-death family protein
MTTTVNIHQAKSQLSKLLQQALSGEEVIIAKDGNPIARLIPIDLNGSRRPDPGIDRHQVIIQPNFDDPLDDFED